MGLNDNNIRFPRWESYQQILFHYYSNAHLRVVNGAILTPAYRWNPLTIDWGGGAVDPPTMYSGGTYNVTLHLQNSGEAEWGSDVKLVYYWLRNGSRVTNSTLVDVDNLDEGDDDNNKNLPVYVPSSFQNGEAVTLVIDLRRTGDGSGRYFSNRESSRPWFDLRYNLCLGGDCISYLPIILKGYTPPVPCPHNQQLIVNSSFEAGRPPTPWVENSPYQIVYNGAGAHSGNWHAYMAGYSNANDKLYQNVNLPTGTTGATLDYYFQLGTYDNTPPAHHFFYVYLRTANGQFIQLLDKFDNTDLIDVWYHVYVNVYNLSSWAGQDLRLSFEVDTDNSSISAFHVDDVNFAVNCNLTSGLVNEVSVEQPLPTQEPAQVPAQVEKPVELRIKP